MTGLTRSAPRGPVTSERRARLRTVVAAGLVAALGAAAAVFAAGYDAREIPREETAVWVARDAGQYARVNTVTREIDTVRQAEDPTQVVQSGADGILFTDGLSRAWPIDPAVPVDVGAASTPSGGSTSEPAEPAQTAAVSGSAPLPGAGGPPVEHTPNGTREVLSAAGTLAVRTDSGGVFLSAPGAERAAGEDAVATPLAGPPSDAAPGSAGRVDGLRPISMPDGAVPPDADAIALDEAGTLALFSRAEGSIRRYDTDRGQFRGGAEPVGAGAADVERPQLALIDGDWALLDPDAGLLWRAGVAEPRALDLSGTAQLQASGPGHDGAALIADEAGLWRVGAEGTPERLAVAEGQPAQPRSIAGQQHAAWLGPEGGTLWAAAGEAAGEARQIPLDPSVDAAARPLHPVLQSNGSRGVLLETGTGMLWTLPDGQLIPVAQWTVTDPPKEDTGAVVVEDVTEQLPPVAVPDEFGVRAGRQAILPVLLNDFDPNKKDVLTIVPESLAEGLDPADFGSAQLLPDAQALTVRVAEHATGSSTLRYRITDGVHVSEPATVTLTVAPEDVNTAPEWCGVEGCQRAWPTPELAPGGTLVLPVLEGWVDPEGDPVVLTAARVTHPADPVRAVVRADGRVAVRHSDPNAPDGPVSIEVTVSDSRGAETTRELVVQISAAAALSFEGMAATVPTGEATELSPLDRVSGGSGDIELVDAVLPASAPGWSVTPRPESGRVTLVADTPGSQTVTVTVRDRVLGSELSGPVRVSAQPGGLALAVPPMRAFVRPLQDATVGVLDALPRGEARGLLVTGVSVTSGELTADVIEQHRVRVAGTTPDGGAGLIGTAEVTVADGTEHATGELTVFQVPEVTDGVVVSVPDAATVRAGSVVDLRVLENDLGPRGERLTLSPEVTGSGAPGELAFASGNTLRYLAPKQAGTYELGYRAFLDSDPERFDTARVTIRVLPAGSNGDPVPAPVTARVLPGQTTRVAVPLTGVDPDGDRVRLVSVDAPGDETISAHLGRRGDEIVIEAGAGAAPGRSTVAYTVRDGQGGEGRGRLLIVVGDPASAQATPVAATDTVRLLRGTERAVLVEPLANDSDPAGGSLTLLSVVPNLPGGEAHPEYRRLAGLVDSSALNTGTLRIRGSAEVGTVSYRYTVRSSASTSTAEGLIVVHVSERVGAEAPRVADTVLSAKDRAELSTVGVDVVTEKVRWASGDPADLTLSVWGTANKRFTAEGHRLLGQYRAEGDLVPFTLSGEDALGNAVTAHGFLTVPPLDELRLTLKPGLDPITVNEGASASFAAPEVIDLGVGDTVELRQGAFVTQRAGASCQATGSTAARYDAGSGGPWADRCVIEARLAGQRSWTRLPVPIRVTPKEPTVELSPVTKTVSPGAELRVDLATDLVRWQGDRIGDPGTLRFSIGEASGPASVSQSGSSVTVRVPADARPGAQTVVPVEVTGAGESRSLLTIRVGAAPKETPRGATVQLRCTVGDPCRVPVIGGPGESDPFAGKPGGGLTLDAVGASSCRVAGFRAAGKTDIEVAWTGAAATGGTCVVPFTVRDAQGRLGEGSLTLDAQGLPQAPASITAVDYSADSLVFRVTLGAEPAHPEVTGVRLTRDGAAAGSCAPEGAGRFRCEVGGLSNGVPHSFAAVAENAVGSSPSSTPVQAWAYRAPRIAQVSAEPRLGPATSPTQGVVRVRISAEADARAFRVENTGQEFARTGGSTELEIALPVGQQRVRVTPLSQFAPPIAGAGPEGQAGTADVLVAGTPGLSDLALGGASERSVSVTGGALDARFSEQGSGVVFRIGPPGGQPASCVADGAGGLVAAPGDQAGGTFAALERFERYAVIACGWNGYGVVQSNTVTATTGELGLPRLVSAWQVRTTPTEDGDRAEYVVAATGAAEPTVDGAQLVWEHTGNATPPTLDAEAASPGFFRVQQCLPDRPDRCSEWLSVPVEGAPNPVTVTGLTQCVDVGQTPTLGITGAARGSAQLSAAAAVPGEPNRARFTLGWGGTFGKLQPLTRTVAVCTPPGGPPDAPGEEAVSP